MCARPSFQVGDLVLIILDERHDNYVLFTVGPTLYFLHSESLTALDLKPGQPFFSRTMSTVLNKYTFLINVFFCAVRLDVNVSPVAAIFQTNSAESLFNAMLCCVLTATGTSRRPWVLGKVMEKEYCQAKKVKINK